MITAAAIAGISAKKAIIRAVINYSPEPMEKGVFPTPPLTLALSPPEGEREILDISIRYKLMANN
jgi:hypothetical protein